MLHPARGRRVDRGGRSQGRAAEPGKVPISPAPAADGQRHRAVDGAGAHGGRPGAAVECVGYHEAGTTGGGDRTGGGERVLS
eukprot:9715129-Prorocentrum_lima.AAC.1